MQLQKVARQKERKKITAERYELMGCKEMLKKDGREVRVILPERITENVNRKTIIYKTDRMKNKDKKNRWNSGRDSRKMI